MRQNYRIAAALAAPCAALIIYLLSLGYFQAAEVSKANGRLSLVRSSVFAEMERFSHLTYVLARDPIVIAAANGADPTVLNARLSAFAGQAGLDAIYLMRPDGMTIAASNAGSVESFVGQSYAFRPYFTQAVAGGQGRFYGIGATTGLPGYFIADAVLVGGDVVGVVAIKLDLTKLEDSWRDAGETVLLANTDGVTLLSSDPEWRYRAMIPLSNAQRVRIEGSRQFPGQSLEQLNWQTRGAQRAEIGGRTWIHLVASDLPHDWSLHYFASNDQAVTRSVLVAGGGVIVLALLFIASQVRKTRLINAALRRSEAEELNLRRANERLAVEIEERKVAEQRLERTQDELSRASRLAALGQLAASVTHELGQPIAAMRNHLAAAEMAGTANASSLMPVAGLVDRMEGITRQLKFFARSEPNRFGAVDLRQAVAASLELVAPNLEVHKLACSVVQPDAPVLVRGNQLRLEQVITNLLRNAADAMDDTEVREIDIGIGQTAGTGWVEVCDRGHGLGDTTLEDLQEPFVTTRESGQGMGLGLAISAGIVQEHHGRITACNRPGGGAIFRVEIPMQQGGE
ncbi:ATP-binding protein [Meridianimarinicoccus aquatilis]|uniref:histidine kinase n=1 Tax=Meridianimarinicoccus aquatilis TaxID=2552766 RepID=A0A4R6AJX1_9RHOB|nr:ATP-binding protein [Fluviibacterium aquatile]TDL84541.1 sensor histidine kinase [Fluviibacterium aquatile]